MLGFVFDRLSRVALHHVERYPVTPRCRSTPSSDDYGVALRAVKLMRKYQKAASRERNHRVRRVERHPVALHSTEPSED